MSDERTEWLAWRKSGIGASDVAALCGMSPFASPMSVWTDKLGLSIDEDNDYLEFGRRAEPMLTGYFEDRTGLAVHGQQDRCVHPAHSHHRCTLDGWVFESHTTTTDPLGVVEYKTQERGTERAWAEAIPDAYAVQVQWQLHVTDMDHAWMGVLHGRTFRVYEVERDQRAIDMLVDVVDQFWTGHVLAEKAPPADAHRATTEALARAFPSEVEGEAVPLDDLTDAIDGLAEAKARASAAKFDIAKHSNAIKAAIGDAEYGTLHGEPVLAYRQQTRAAHEVKASTFRKLTPIGAKP